MRSAEEGCLVTFEREFKCDNLQRKFFGIVL